MRASTLSLAPISSSKGTSRLSPSASNSNRKSTKIVDERLRKSKTKLDLPFPGLSLPPSKKNELTHTEKEISRASSHDDSRKDLNQSGEMLSKNGLSTLLNLSSSKDEDQVQIDSLLFRKKLDETVGDIGTKVVKSMGCIQSLLFLVLERAASSLCHFDCNHATGHTDDKVTTESISRDWKTIVSDLSSENTHDFIFNLTCAYTSDIKPKPQSSLKDDIDLFASMFAATFKSEITCSVLRYCAMSRTARSVSPSFCTNDIPSIFSVLSSETRSSLSVDALKVSKILILEESIRHISTCACRVSQSNVHQRNTFVRQLVDSLDAVVIPMRIPKKKMHIAGCRSGGDQRLGMSKANNHNAQRTISKPSTQGSLSNILSILVFKLHLAYILLEERHHASLQLSSHSEFTEQEKLWRVEVGRELLRVVTSDNNIYEFHTSEPTKKGRLDSIKYKKIKGFSALLSYVLQVKTSNSKLSLDIADPGELTNVRTALHHVLLLYLHMLPDRVASQCGNIGVLSSSEEGAYATKTIRVLKQSINNTSVNIHEESGGYKGTGRYEQLKSDEMRVLSSLTEAWLTHQHTSRVEDAAAFIEWLRLVPVLMTSISNVVERCLELENVSLISTNPCENREDELSRLTVVAQKLSLLLNEMLFYDSSAFEATRQVASTNAEIKTGDDNSSESPAEDMDNDPVQRLRRKRSIFNKGRPSDGGVLREVGETTVSAPLCTNRGVNKGGPSRFVVRNSSRLRGEITERDGHNHNTLGRMEEGSSALFRVLVLSQDAVPTLLDAFSTMAKYENINLSEIWIDMIYSMGRLQQLIYGKPPSLQKHLAATPVKWDSSPTKDGQSLVGGDNVVSLLDKKSVKEPIVHHDPSSLTDISLEDFPHLLALIPISSINKSHYHRVLNIICNIQKMIPLKIFDSTLRMANTLMKVLLAQYQKIKQLESLTAGRSISFKMDVIRQRNELYSFLLTGSHELLWGNSSFAFAQGIQVTWKLRLGFFSGTPYTPQRAMTSNTLTQNIYQVMVRIGKLSLQQPNKIPPIIKTSIDILKMCTSAPAGGSLAPYQIPLSVFGAQMCSVSILHGVSILDSLHRNCIKSVTPLTSNLPETNRSKPIIQLIELFSSNYRLLLLCCYPIFFQKLYDTIIDVIGIHEEFVAQFVGQHLLPVSMTMVLISLHNSRNYDTPSAHTFLCEQTLMLLAILSHFTEYQIRYSKDRARIHSSTMGVLQPWIDILMSVSIYCLRLSKGGDGIMQSGDLHFVPPFLPQPSSLPGSMWEDVSLVLKDLLTFLTPLQGASHSMSAVGAENVQPTTESKMPDDCTRFFLRFLHHSNDLYPSNIFHWSRGDHFNQILDALHVYSFKLENSASFSAYHVNVSSAVMSVTTHGNIADKKRVQRYRDLTMAGMNNTIVKVIDTIDDNILVSFEQQHEMAQRWYGVLAAAQIPSTKQIGPAALHQHIVNAQILVKLMRFLVKSIRQSLRLNATHAQLQPTVILNTGTITTMNEACVIALDYMGCIRASGGWYMVYWILSIAEMAVSVEKVARQRVSETTRTVIISSIFYQLRAVPSPPRDHVSLMSFSYLSKTLASLSDILSKGRSTTLLGISRREHLTGLLGEPSADDLRSVIFGIKQSVLYIESGTRPLRRARPITSEEADATEEDEIAFETTSGDSFAGIDNPGAFSRSGSREAVASYYDSTLKGNKEGTAKVEDKKLEFRRLMHSIVAAFDVILECILHHLLRQGVMQKDLMSIVAISYNLLCRIFCECVLALTELPIKYRLRFNQSEFGMLLWSGLSIVANMSCAWHTDDSVGTVFFVGRVFRSSQDLVHAIQRLIDCFRPENILEADFQNRIDLCRQYPICSTLIRSLHEMTQDVLYIQKRYFGVADRYSSNDNFTEVLKALYVLLSHAAKHPATAGVAHEVWKAIHFELASVAHAPKHHLKNHKNTGTVDSNNIFLQVPSLTELEWALKAFKDIAYTSASHSSVGLAAPGSGNPLSQYCYENIDDLLLVFRESSTALVTQRKASPTEESGNKEEGTILTDATINYDSFLPKDSYALEFLDDLCVEEVLRSEALPVEKVVDIVIQQAKGILMLRNIRLDFPNSMLRKKGRFSSPQTQHQVAAYVRNLLGLFNACSLATICQNPGVEDLFMSFRVLVDLETIEEESAEDLSSTSKTTIQGSHSTEILLCVKQLWEQLRSKMQRELLDTNETVFHRRQDELTRLVRRHLDGRLRGRKERSPSTGSRPDMFALGSCSDSRKEQWLFSILSKRSPTSRYPSTDMNAVYEALLFTEAGVICAHPSSAEADSASPDQSTKYVDPVLEMAVSTAKLLERHLPLSVVFALLQVFSSISSESNEFRMLVETVCTYVSRQYVVLRPLLEDTALDVLPLLGLLQPWLACIRSEGESALHPNHKNAKPETDQLNEVIARCRVISLLSPTNGCAEPVRGTFFRPKQRAQLRRYFAEASGIKEEVSAGLERINSEEVLTYGYIRTTILYLHLLSLQIVVLSRFNLQGSIIEELKLFLRQQAHDRIQSAKRWKVQSSAASGVETVQGIDPSAGLPFSLLLRGDYSPWATNDQMKTDPFVAALQHFANVSFVLLRHTDSLTHFAAVQAMCEKGHEASNISLSSENPSTRCVAFADELRHLVASSLQSMFKTVLSTSEHTLIPLARVVVQHLISSFPCEAVMSNPAVMSAAAKTKDGHKNFEQLHQHWRFQRPEWFVASPTMLEILTPSFFARYLSTSHISTTSTSVASSIATSLLVYEKRKDISLPPLLMATTALLGTASKSITPLRLLCENLAQDMVRREDFLHALVPHTAAALTHRASSFVSNEVLIPFLAAIAREDVHVSKQTLSVLLHTAMRMRPDVFGHPPTPKRQGMLSLLQPLNQDATGHGDFLRMTHSLSFPASPSSLENEMDSQRGTEVVQKGEEESKGLASPTTEPHQSVSDVEGEELTALDALSMHLNDDVALTHRQVLERLNISLATTFEVAMHMQVLRTLNKEEYRHAANMLKTADDDRRERINTSILQANDAISAPQQPSSLCQPLNGKRFDRKIDEAHIKIDASLHLKDHMDYGVALLHLRFALRKIIHASFRRLARHQLPSALAKMAEALYEVDRPGSLTRPKTQQQKRETNDATDVRPNVLHSPMLLGTLRVFSARAILCAQSIGYSPNGTPIVLRVTSRADPTAPQTGDISSPLLLSQHSSSSSQSTRSKLKYSEVNANDTEAFAGLQSLEEEGELQKITAEANSAIAVSSSYMRLTQQSRLRINHALSSMKRESITMSASESLRKTPLTKRYHNNRKGVF
ncbi:unnamed protein product [Phytomonas sp. Hart1]|nr:unnamed protein product [Phytomonas sp. Hart1]|eukprot:CCW68790.1 unnamed protein product [Phytomonas sp. isolate Hart1]